MSKFLSLNNSNNVEIGPDLEDEDLALAMASAGGIKALEEQMRRVDEIKRKKEFERMAREIQLSDVSEDEKLEHEISAYVNNHQDKGANDKPLTPELKKELHTAIMEMKSFKIGLNQTEFLNLVVEKVTSLKIMDNIDRNEINQFCAEEVTAIAKQAKAIFFGKPSTPIKRPSSVAKTPKASLGEGVKNVIRQLISELLTLDLGLTDDLFLELVIDNVKDLKSVENQDKSVVLEFCATEVAAVLSQKQSKPLDPEFKEQILQSISELTALELGLNRDEFLSLVVGNVSSIKNAAEYDGKEINDFCAVEVDKKMSPENSAAFELAQEQPRYQGTPLSPEVKEEFRGAIMELKALNLGVNKFEFLDLCVANVAALESAQGVDASIIYDFCSSEVDALAAQIQKPVKQDSGSAKSGGFLSNILGKK